MKKKLLSLLLALAMVFTLAACGEKKPDPGKDATATEPVVILHTNDVHGAVSNYAKVAALASQYESEGAYVLILDAGDFSQGDTAVSVSEGATAVELMNMVGYDAVALGNHEFDYGFEALKKNMENAQFPVLAANVKYNGELAFDDAAVFTTPGGTKIGVFGLDTPETATKAHPGKIQGVTFAGGEELYQIAQDMVNMLREDEGCNYVICLGHLGIDDETAATGNRSIDLLNKVTGIDVFIDGHSHSTEEEIVEKTNTDRKVGDTILTSTGTKLENIGVIVIDDASKKIESNSLYEIKEDTAKDAAVAAAAQKIIDRIDKEYGAVFAKSKVELNGAKAPNGNRDGETNNGDLITDAMLWKVMQNKEGLTVNEDHVVAITNGGGIRAAIKAGDVTKKDIKTVLPFGNTIEVIYVTGTELLEALEASTFCVPESIGGFPQVSGISYTISTGAVYDANAETYPASTYYGPKSINRVTINSINGKDFKLGDTYAVVTNNFSAAGGDTYYAFKAATAKFDTGVPLDEAVMEYVTKELKGVIGEQYAAPQGRILMNPFKDVKVSSWFGQYVIDLYNDGIINGTSATTYAPNDTLTWAAALKLLLVSHGDLKAADATGADWSKNTIAKAAELGLVAADLDGAKAISRLEFCQVAAKLNKLAESKTESKFTDCADGYVMALVDAKVISGMTETTFEPDASLTRAQIAKIIYQLNLIEK